MRLRSPILLTLLFVVAAICGGLAAETHPFSIHDMLAMERISDPQVSPNGEKVVFTLRTTDLAADKGRTDLWLIGADGVGLRRLSSHTAGDSSGRWSPDGKWVYFLSGRSDSSQVWRIRIDGGEAEQVTDLPLDLGNLLVSPDGEHIAFTMEVFPGDCPAETKEKLDEIEERKATGRIYEQIFVRHWDTWKDGRRSHVFVMPAAGGESIDVMVDMDADSPSKPFGGPEEITFTPDGKAIVFSARDVGKREAWSTDFDLYVAPVDGTKPPECLTEKNEAWDTNPLFSPDGKTLAYLAMARAGYESDRFRIVLRTWASGQERVLTESWDRSPSSLCFSADGRKIYATATNTGQRSLFSIDLKGGSVRTVVKEGAISSPGIAAERIIYGLNSLSSPTELYSVNPDGSDIKQITNINAEKLAAA
ncbi:MAG: PD40 domain-containing protein, partial [Planctomycetes bacterium]|nr:PD40 domain-containing protein [Planctomycetota bacterium]